jgi:beta-xylosidase
LRLTTHICFFLLALALVRGLATRAQTPELPTTMDERLGRFGDQADGTYINPILPGDFQNTDVLRVGPHFYYIVATKAMSPGMAVMQSDDLINWKFIGHVVPDITVFNPRFSSDSMEGAQRGVWAGTLAFHAGLFYVYFTTPDEGIFVSTAKDPAGPWSPLLCLMPGPGWDDPAPLFDDDGKAYLATTNFAVDPKNGKSYNIHLYQMAADGLSLKLDTDRIIYQSRGSEANKLYKINGLYYHFFSEVTREGRVPIIARAKDVAGPYELHQLNHVNGNADRGPNQGSLLETPNGKWVFITHHGANEWEGRPASLLPVTWIDGWPIAGQPGADGIGNMVWQDRKPISSHAPISSEFTDEFNKPILAPEWEWYFQPKPGAWSLTERPGFLRLHAVQAPTSGGLLKTPDILTIRPLRVSHNEAVIKMDIAHMSNGQTAGLCFLGRTTAEIAYMQGDASGFYFQETDGPRIVGGGPAKKTVWLKTAWDTAGVARFSFSLDGETFTPLGAPYQITSFGGFLGAKLGIFSAGPNHQGYVDVDSFRYTYSH